MKKLSIVVLLFSLISCSKNDGPVEPPNTNTGPLVFEITGLADTTMMQIDTLEFPISVNYVSGKKELIGLGVMHMPDSMTVIVEPQIDTPSYDGLLRIITKGASPGTHVIQLRASGATVEKDFYMQLNVRPDPANAAIPLAGIWNEAGNCSTSGSKDHEVEISPVATAINKIAIKGIWNGENYRIVANLDPDLKAVTIPSQPSGGLMFSGSGVYDTSQIQIDYHVTDGAIVNDYCTVTMSR